MNHVPSMIVLQLVLFRIVVALVTRTAFQPDEYYQSLEPAHAFVFSYGHLTWEWLSQQPIRSFVYPALNVPIFWLLKVTGLHDYGALGRFLVVALPKVFHGSLATLTDIAVRAIASRSLGQRYSSTALFLSITSFFHALSLSRSLSNSLETSFTAMAFVYYPWDVSPNLSPHLIYYRPRFYKMITFAALACLIRPTNVVIWIFLFSKLLWALRSSPRSLGQILQQSAIAFVSAACFLTAVDSLYYGKLTFTPLNFVVTNASNVSLFYGSNPWHYYLSQAFPILTTTVLPFVFYNAWSTFWRNGSRMEKNMWETILWTTTVFSLSGHKEWRFLHPIVPLLHVTGAKALVHLSPNGPHAAKAGNENSFFSHVNPPIRPAFKRFILLNVPVALYIMLFYCSGPISVMSFVRNLPSPELQYEGAVGFLMPCHSTPGHAYLHREELANGNMWALGCEPPLENQNLTEYKDQTSLFFHSPQEYLTTRFPVKVNAMFPASPYPASPPGEKVQPTDPYPWRHEWPRYLVFFGALLEREGVGQLLADKGYREVWHAGRSWEGDTDERKGGVRVWKWETN